MKIRWFIFNILSIVLLGTYARLSLFLGELASPLLLLVDTDMQIAISAGIYVFAFFLGLFGALYKPSRRKGFVFASWIGLCFMVYVHSEVWRG